MAEGNAEIAVPAVGPRRLSPAEGLPRSWSGRAKDRAADARRPDAVQAYDWRGNVRELENVVARAVILSVMGNRGSRNAARDWADGRHVRAAPNQ
jgi:transcriptional regulator with GAF, ATPase, and Fis domain